MSNEKLARVVKGLVKQTDEGKIAWQPTAAEGLFQASLPNITAQISIQQNEHNSDFMDVVILLRNKEGAVLERFTDADLLPNHLSNAFDVMMGLYNAARRQALGVDEAIDDLLKDLGE